MSNRIIELEATLRLALEQIKAGSYECAIDRLEEALMSQSDGAQPEQDIPVMRKISNSKHHELSKAQPEQPPQRTWVGLTDVDRQEAFESMPDMLDGFLKKWGWLHFSKAIEAKLKEKNT